MSVLKIWLAVIGIAAFATISHLALSAQHGDLVWRQIAVAGLLLPVLAIGCWSCIGLLAGMRLTTASRLLFSAAIVALALYAALLLRPLLLSHLPYMYLTEHVCTNLMLCWLFAHTLLGSHTPLVTTFARATHDFLPDKILCYTRYVTQAWAIFFLLQALVSLLLFHLASIETWSWFANVMNWPLVALMFGAEYICRKRMNPDFPHSTIQQSVAAYFNSRRKI